MVEFIYLSLHANLKFPQRIIVTQDAEKHDDEVSPSVKTLYILLTTDGLMTQLLIFALSSKFITCVYTGCPVKYVLLPMFLGYFLAKTKKQKRS